MTNTNPLRLGRALLRLRDVTAVELADLAAVPFATAKSYLHRHEKLGIVERAGAKPAQGKGRPATRWRLTDGGHRSLTADLTTLFRDEPDSVADERAAYSSRLRRTLSEILAASEVLERRATELEDAEWEETGHRLRRRITIAHQALASLEKQGEDMAVEKSALEAAFGKLEQAQRERSCPSAQVSSVKDELSAYVNSWWKDLYTEIDGVVPRPHCECPDEPQSAPIILLDGIRGSDELSSGLWELGRASRAPILCVAADRLAAREQLLSILARRLRTPVGCATQLILTLDSQDEAARTFAASFVRLDEQRRRWSGASQALTGTERNLLSAAGSLMLSVGAAAATAGVAPLSVSAAVMMIQGALTRRIVNRRPDSPEFTPGRDYVRANCIDVDEMLALQPIFGGSDVSYTSVDLLIGEPERFRPLTLDGAEEATAKHNPLEARPAMA